MTDQAYDALEDRLKELDPSNPFLKNMNDDVNFQQEVKLPVILGSQNKALTLSDLDPFINKVSNNPLHCSMKLDGMSCLLIYKAGKLVQASTRGNGFIGLDITKVAKCISSIPQTLPEPIDCMARGEITISKADLVKLQAEQAKNGEEPYKNTRNGAVAIVKTPDNAKYYKYLDFHAYDFWQN